MESGPVCRPKNRPRMLICYLCGREYGTRSLPIHVAQCQKKWLLEEEKKPKNEQRPLPPQPNATIRSGDRTKAYDSFNSEAFAAFEQTLQQCPHCQRRFLPKPFLRHQKGCTAANPAKPAGTGLIPISLTNRLVPGAVAGSMHGKARTQHVPLSLCKPSESSNWKSKTQSRPNSARPVWSNEEDSFSIDDEYPGQGSHWRDASCVELRTRNRPPSSKPSSHQGNGGSHGGGEKSHLVDTFGNLWRTHNLENSSVPLMTTRDKSGAQKWCSQEVTETSLSSNRAAYPRPKSARFTPDCRQSPSTALRSLHASPRERNFLDSVALAKTLPNSGEDADHSANSKLAQAGKIGGDFRHHQRSHH